MVHKRFLFIGYKYANYTHFIQQQSLELMLIVDY